MLRKDGEQRPIDGDQALIELYNRSGVKVESDKVIGSLPEQQAKIILYTHNGSATKVKPMLPYLLSTHNGIPEPTARSLAASVDLLWTLSVIVDDIQDGDTVRRGKEASWVKYGKEETMAAAHACLEKVMGYLYANFGKEVVGMCKQYIEEGLQSQATQHELRLDSTPEQILHQYSERDSFFTTFPLVAAFALHQPQNTQKANECALGLQAYNQGGQIGNDLNDLTPKADGRYRFSDIKNGQVTLPIFLLYARLDETQREYFLSRFGKRDLTAEEATQIREFIEDHGIIDLGLEAIWQQYETARALLKCNLSEEWQVCFDSLCALQMQKFSKYKLEH